MAPVHKLHRLGAVVVSMFLLAACQSEPSPLGPSLSAAAETTTSLTGTVLAPRRLLEPALGPGQPPPSPPPIPVASPPPGPEVPVAGADVFLADARGTRIPGIPLVHTNADGSYRLTGVPSGYPYLLVASFRDTRARPISLSALVRVRGAEAVAEVRTATTMVTTAAIADSHGLLNPFDPAAYDQAVDAVSRQLPADDYPDPGDPAALPLRLQAIAAAEPTLQPLLDGLRSELRQK